MMNRMDVKLRPGTPEDAAACGRICYDAFAAIAAAHGMPCDFPSLDVATGLVASLLAHPGIFGVVAEANGVAVGSNFLDERTAIAGVGPITVDPAVQDASAGRQLMVTVMERAAARGSVGVRLVQAAYHTRSLALYATLGFEVREPFVTPQGPPLAIQIPGHAVRQATEADLDGCDALCRRVHGHDRHGELREAIADGTAAVVEHGDRLTGYATVLGFPGHAVGESHAALKALIGGRLGVRRARLSAADAQRGVVPLVSGARPPGGPAHDADEPGPL
jgi:predicted N-acetyltransferase YhbS